MSKIEFNDYSDGWIPSDDALNGRKTGLLKMDGVMLDEHGALILANGTKRYTNVYPALAHTLFSKFVCGVKRRYLSLVDGSIYRDTTQIVAPAGANLTRGAFGVFSDFVLLSIGKAILKDACDNTTTNIVLDAPTVAPTVAANATTFIDSTAAGTFANFVVEYGVLITAPNLEIDPTAPYLGYNVGSAHNLNAGDFPPKNLSGIDNDLFQFDLSMFDPSGFHHLEINFHLTNTGLGDYYALAIELTDITLVNPATFTTISKKRSDFTRVGTNTTLGWNTVFGIQIICRSKITSVGESFVFKNFKWVNVAASPLNGTYTWVQLNVLKSNAYEAKSVKGPVSTSLTLENAAVTVTPQSPAAVEPEANEVWIYRKGGDLPDYYRVKREVIPYAAFTDNLSDDDALALGIILNENLLPLNSTNLVNDIIEIIGPIAGRMLYFTKADLLFSPPNQPDSFDPALTIKICGSDGEIFYWARKVAENIVLVGTSRDVYTLTGTYITQPDGSLDVYYRPLAMDKPPVCRDVTLYKTSLIYFTPFGWRLLSTGGDHNPITYPNVNLLYTGITLFGYGGVPTKVADGFRYSVAVSKDKLWLIVPVISDYTNETTINDSSTWTKRLEVYDLLDKTWRALNYCPNLVIEEEDGGVLAFFADKRLTLLDYPFSALLNHV